MRKTRLAIIVSHPIQYYAPLHQRLARRSDLEVKVFFTWHAGKVAMNDRGFDRPVVWDVPLTDGYEHELVPNSSSDPGDHHFFGLNNPTLAERVLEWRPNAVHITGWAFYSNLTTMRTLARRGIPTLFRGDSHLLDGRRSGPRWWLKWAVLRRVYSWPSAFLFVGKANKAYYQTFGVDESRLFACPHSIDVSRFRDPDGIFEREASAWRRSLGIDDDKTVALFAGKFESKKRPLELMRAVAAGASENLTLLMAGGGKLEPAVRALAASNPNRFKVLPFQNQSRMPVLYRMADLMVLPSSFGETWGMAVNEALACGRPVLVSDRVGCAADLVDESCGAVFSWNDIPAMMRMLNALASDRPGLKEKGLAAARRADAFDIAASEESVINCLRRVCPR